MNVSARTLKVLAAAVWYTGGIVLLLKVRSLLGEAIRIQPDSGWPWIAITAGVAIGALKARFIFNRSCRRNLQRIDGLTRRRPWDFFRLGFFLFLFLMIAAGATMSRLAHGNYPFLIGVAIVDLTIATALIGSSYVFWKQRAFTA